jgi:hypothetical protein
MMENGNSASSGAAVTNSVTASKLEQLPVMVQGVMGNDAAVQTECTTQFRRLLSIEKNPPIQQVIDSGVVPRFVEFLQRDDNPALQFEAEWVRIFRMIFNPLISRSLQSFAHKIPFFLFTHKHRPSPILLPALPNTPKSSWYVFFFLLGASLIVRGSHCLFVAIVGSRRCAHLCPSPHESQR